MEREDVDFLAEHLNDINCMGEHWWTLEQRSKSDFMKRLDNPSNLEVLIEAKFFYHSEERWDSDRGDSSFS
jgi:hypothetical protein